MYYRLLLVTTVLVPLVAGQARKARAQEPAVTENVEQYVDSVLLRQISETGRELGKRAWARGRRAYVLGPSVGVAGASALDGGFDGAVSFGLDLTKFAIPLFTNRDEMIAVARSRFKELMIERATIALASGPAPTEADMRQFAEESWQQLRAELFSDLEARRFEKPGLALRLEGNYFFDSGAFDLRLAGSIGVSKLFVGTALTLKVDDGAAFVMPLELSLPVALSMDQRSSLLHIFARIDFAVTGRDEHADVALLGLRYQLDII